MYALVRDLESRTALAREAVTFLVAFALAEVFYKFHSFSLKCLAFLATWTVLSGLADLGGRLFHQPDRVNEDV